MKGSALCQDGLGNEVTAPKRRRYNFTMDHIEHFLYGQNKIPRLKMEKDNKGFEKPNGHVKECFCDECNKTFNIFSKTDPLDSLEKFVHGEDDSKSTIKQSYAVTSVPDQVELCDSAIPGAGKGVRAKLPIPVGTWIGPYEGKKLRPEEMTNDSTIETSYMWEIYDNGHLIFYMDGLDEEESSWMRFIRCARYKQEQNLYMFQYCGEIYYRVFRDIAPGAELLVWYDTKYIQHMGIPVGLDVSYPRKLEDVQVDCSENSFSYSPIQPQYSFNKEEFQNSRDYESTHFHASNGITSITPYFETPSIMRSPQCVDVKSNDHHLQTGQGSVVLPMASPSIAQVHPHLAPHVQLQHATMYYQQQKAKPTREEVMGDYSMKYNSQETNCGGKQNTENVVKSRGDLEFEQFRKDLKMKRKQKRKLDIILPKEKQEIKTEIFHLEHKAQLKTVMESSQKYDIKNRTIPLMESEGTKALVSKDAQSYMDKQVIFKYPPHSSIPLSHREDEMISSGYMNIKQEYVHDTPPQSPPDEPPHIKRDQNGTKDQMNKVQNIDHSSDDSNVWKCGQCNKTFSQRMTLQLHVCTRCPNKPYQCGHCFMSFSKPGALKNHVITHTNDKPFKCGFCSRAFSGATTLNNHIRTHTGEKPFSCNKCGKFFSQATQLSRHQRIPSDCVC